MAVLLVVASLAVGLAGAAAAKPVSGVAQTKPALGATGFPTVRGLEDRGLGSGRITQIYSRMTGRDRRQATPVVTRSASNAFDWRDAGIGAAGGLAIATSAVVVALFARRLRVQSPAV
ncbi:MAG TPA: hypothetical protein VF025_13535 [Gaiellaceae bacterium]